MNENELNVKFIGNQKLGILLVKSELPQYEFAKMLQIGNGHLSQIINQKMSPGKTTRQTFMKIINKLNLKLGSPLEIETNYFSL